MSFYFVSDVHLGLSTHRSAEQTELMFERWLLMVEDNLMGESDPNRGVFLVGDIFDFWFEYKHVVPKGFVTTLAILKRMCKNGIDVYMLKGNHDCWSKGYLAQFGIKCVENPSFEIKVDDNTTLYVAHGDHIQSKTSIVTRLLYSIFNSKVAYSLFSRLVHPDIAMWFGNNWSSSSRKGKYIEHTFTYDDEPLVKFVRERRSSSKRELYVFGHLHSPTLYNITDTKTILVLGHWVEGNPYYGLYKDNNLQLIEFKAYE